MKKLLLIFAITGLLTSCGNESPDSKDSSAKEEKMENKSGAGSNSSDAEMDGEASQPKEVSITLKTTGETMTDMQYDPKRLEVPAGAMVTLTLENTASSEAMIHNFVLTEFGKEEKLYEMALKAGSDKNYVPESPLVLASTGLANPGESQKIEFRAPLRAGNYRYICTYPGHTSMKGVMIVK